MKTFRPFYLIVSIFVFLICQCSTALAQITKDSSGYNVFDPLGQDSIPDSPTFQSILHERPGKTIDRILWYRFGPKVGVILPFQPKLVQHFNAVAYFIGADFLYSRDESGFGPALDYYSITRLQQYDRYNPEANRERVNRRRDRFSFLSPSYTYQHFFFIQPDFIPFVEVDAKYMIGIIRVNSEHINTGLKSSYGTSAEVGALLSDRFKFDLSLLLMHPVMGYSLSGITASISFLFYPVHTW